MLIWYGLYVALAIIIVNWAHLSIPLFFIVVTSLFYMQFRINVHIDWRLENCLKHKKDKPFQLAL